MTAGAMDRPMSQLASIPEVAHVEWLGGEPADDAPIDLVVEVPHGADRRAHYDALRGRLVGDLPADLHEFFHVNTDVGAWQYGRRVAERVVAARPGRRALLIRCLIPRTFVDTNRVADASAEDLAKGGLTAGVAPYVRDPADVALLLDLHRRYVELADAAYARVCGQGGFGLNPHTYGPVTLGVERVDDRIVDELRRVHQPELYGTWPVRPEVDLITRTQDGASWAPDGAVERLTRDYGALGLGVVDGGTYFVHPSTQGHRWSTRHRGQVLCLEVRRDLLVERYTWDREMVVEDAKVERVAGPLAALIDDWLAQRGR